MLLFYQGGYGTREDLREREREERDRGRERGGDYYYTRIKI